MRRDDVGRARRFAWCEAASLIWIKYGIHTCSSMNVNSSKKIDMKHLTQKQVEELARRLTERTRSLAARVREELVASDTQHYRDLAGSVTDTADEALASALVDVDTAIIDHHVNELRDIAAAQERMKMQTYGICIDCGEEVAYERLAAYPIAKRCVPCQQQRERVYARRGTPNL